MNVARVPPSALPHAFNEKHVVLDVRTPAEYRSSHVDGAESLPLDQLDAANFCTQRGTDIPVYLLCQTGKRATLAAEKLVRAGHPSVFVVDGGSDAARAHGLPMTHGKGSLSIERQVRIVAGLLVLCGTLAGWFVHAGFFWIPGFVGAGLTFAGITDTCGMAMVLAKCPWNR